VCSNERFITVTIAAGEHHEHVVQVVKERTVLAVEFLIESHGTSPPPPPSLSSSSYLVVS
jgi:hypothetical protein